MRSTYLLSTIVCLASTSFAAPAPHPAPLLKLPPGPVNRHGFYAIPDPVIRTNKTSIHKRTSPTGYGGQVYGHWTTCPDSPLSPEYIEMGYFRTSYDSGIHSSRCFLAWPWIEKTNMTKELCFGVCKGSGYRYAGFKMGQYCTCGNNINGDLTKSVSCDLPCAGDGSKSCGGNYAYSIFRDGTYDSGYDGNKAANHYESIGCYWEDPENILRTPATLINGAAGSDSMGTVKCKGYCAAAGYAYAGITKGNFCRCGGALRAQAEVGDPNACNLPCTGEPGEQCGGAWAVVVYYNADLDSNRPCGAKATKARPKHTNLNANATLLTEPGVKKNTTVDLEPRFEKWNQTEVKANQTVAAKSNLTLSYF
ncbi:hypothetical protein H072_4477 [Dactylellina haptotyla CBS 200.50]|uniref:WSC domain-containing protein n=1 Tax=Dactylellina haptotyla (strain CBS 200.50) TaxID=1284197 RepID=S8AEZ2_DACHA|nr:hypothetical protein H072_4477 [Dactylellina haptotyla CBS 200.50]